MKQIAIILFILLVTSCKLHDTPVHKSNSDDRDSQISLNHDVQKNNPNNSFKSETAGKDSKLKGRLKLSKEIDERSREFGGAFIDESLMFRTR